MFVDLIGIRRFESVKIYNSREGVRTTIVMLNDYFMYDDTIEFEIHTLYERTSKVMYGYKSSKYGYKTFSE